jgi:hypothetical protein
MLSHSITLVHWLASSRFWVRAARAFALGFIAGEMRLADGERSPHAPVT